MNRHEGQLDHELVEWRAESLICELYAQVLGHLGDHPIREAVRLMENLQSWRAAVHGLEPERELEPASPDGLWGDLAECCEEATWELARLELAGAG